MLLFKENPTRLAHLEKGQPIPYLLKRFFPKPFTRLTFGHMVAIRVLERGHEYIIEIVVVHRWLSTGGHPARPFSALSL